MRAEPFARLRLAAGASVFICIGTAALAAGPQPAAPAHRATKPAVSIRTFSTPGAAAEALVAAAGTFDVAALERLFGRNFADLVVSGERAADRQRAAEFSARAGEQRRVSIEPANPARAVLLVGKDDWPFPVPIVKRNGRWAFDAKGGRHELLVRRVGANELDAITICRGYVEAQHQYALRPREGFDVPQYAQRIISTPNTQDGLAWQQQDGTWTGPIGVAVARAITDGYSSGQPYHGYFFKILKGQGPAAPLGQLDFVIKGAMIGGFALAASPAEYGVTGVKTFIVSHDGVVYEKDFGRNTSAEFSRLERFNPDPSWQPVSED